MNELFHTLQTIIKPRKPDQITLCLHAIEAHANWISHYCEHQIKQHAAHLEQAINVLPERPEWKSKARDELQKSTETLRLTLALCRSALEAYDQKPINEKFGVTEAAE